MKGMFILMMFNYDVSNSLAPETEVRLAVLVSSRNRRAVVCAILVM